MNWLSLILFYTYFFAYFGYQFKSSIHIKLKNLKIYIWPKIKISLLSLFVFNTFNSDFLKATTITFYFEKSDFNFYNWTNNLRLNKYFKFRVVSSSKFVQGTTVSPLCNFKLLMPITHKILWQSKI